MENTLSKISALSDDEMSAELYELKLSGGERLFKYQPSFNCWDSALMQLAESQCIGICYDGIFGDNRPTAYYGARVINGKAVADLSFSDEDPKRAIAGCLMLLFGWSSQ